MPRFNTPADVQAHFYRAIEMGDAHAMMQVWSEDEPLVCIHPGAPRLDDRLLIAESWEQILASEAQLSFRLSEEHCIEQPTVAVCTARVEIALDGEWIDTVLTTNVYQNSAQGWLMVVHHASPDPSFDETDAFDDMLEIDESDNVVLH